MADRKAVTADIDFIIAFKQIMQAYEEISTMKMKKIRLSVLATRDFLDRLEKVYYNVKASYRKRIEDLLSDKHKKAQAKLDTLSAFKKNGKSLYVLISANTKLHGDIVMKVFSEFKETIKKAPGDVMIIGRLGRELYEQANLGKNYLYYEIPDVDLKAEDLKQIVFHMVQYDKVAIFHGRFESIVTQNPHISAVSGDVFFKKDLEEKLEEERFIFEPSLERVLGFFETQVFSSLLEQSAYEGALARFASRIKSMEQALEKIEGIEKGLVKKRVKIKKQLEQKKQNEKFAGMRFWSR